MLPGPWSLVYFWGFAGPALLLRTWSSIQGLAGSIPAGPKTLTRCTAIACDRNVRIIKYERAKEEASTLVNAQASQDVGSLSLSDLAAKPAANVAPSQSQSQVLDLVEASPSPWLRVPWQL